MHLLAFASSLLHLQISTLTYVMHIKIQGIEWLLHPLMPWIKNTFFDFNGYIHSFLEKSSMQVTKYHAPPIDMVFIGLHKFECIISNTLVPHLPLTSLGKGYFVVGLQCNLQMLKRTNQMKMGQDPCHLPCLEERSHFSHWNGQGIDAIVSTCFVLHHIMPKWPFQLHSFLCM